MAYDSLRNQTLLAGLLVFQACGGGGSSGGEHGGALSARALWQQQNTAAVVDASAQQAGGDRFGPDLPGSARTVRFVFSPSSGDACCVAVDPRSIPVDPNLQQRVLVLPQLPVGPGSLTIAAFPTDFAPAPAGVATTCATRPAAAGQPCEQAQSQTPSFSSDPHPVNIRLGIDSDAGDVLVRAVPFVVPGTLRPGVNEETFNPVAAEFTVADAVNGIDPSSILLRLAASNGAASDQPLQLRSCDDTGADPCSTNGDLQVTGFAVTRLAQELAPGGAEGRIGASNLGTPPQNLDFRYRFAVLSGPRTVTATVRPTGTVTAGATATRTATVVPTGSTVTRTTTPIPSRTPTATRRVTATSARTRTRTPTPGPPPSPTIFFIGAEPLTVSARPEFQATGDFNLDGRADLVVISPLSEEMNVLVGSSESASGFSPVTVFRFGQRLRSPAVGDLNADGNPDIVVPDSGDVGVWIVLGNGDGTFVRPSFVAVGSAPFAVAVADFDGRPGDDVAVADRQRNSVLLLLSNGTTPLAFSTGPELLSGAEPEAIATVDLNRDGQADLATLNVGGAATIGVLVSQREGEGSPVFARVTSYEAGVRPQSLTVADLDGDAIDDLVLLNRPIGAPNHGLAAYLSVGDGSLDPLPVFDLSCPFVTTNACPSRGLAAGDFEQDGNVDLAITMVDPRGSSNGDAVRILRGRGDGSFANGPVFGAAKDAMAISAGDYGGDGPIDLAVSSPRDVNVQGFINVSILASGGNSQGSALDEASLAPARSTR
jgi:hypothetical protein